MAQCNRGASDRCSAVYVAFAHGLIGRWSYLSRTVSNIGDLLQPTENGICNHLISALTGWAGIADLGRELIALLTRHRGMGISNQTKKANEQFMCSKRV